MMRPGLKRQIQFWLGTLLLLVIGIGGGAWYHFRAVRSSIQFIDQPGLVSSRLNTQFNRLLDSFRDEMGVDVRIVLVKSTGNESLDDFTRNMMRDADIGSHTDGRGLLCVYDEQTQGMHMAVEPKLKGVITDAFVSYLERENAHAFTKGSNLSMVLRPTLLMLDQRLREAALGLAYDPHPAQGVQAKQQLAEGAGPGIVNRHADAKVRARYMPQPTAADAYRKYLQWLSEPYEYGDVPFLTTSSQTFLSHQPLPPIFFDFLLYEVYGHHYKVLVKGDLAMVYYTDTPFVSPWFFRRGPQGWQMDIIAAADNSAEYITLPYTWSWRWSGDEYSKAFMPYLVREPGGFVRVKDGDNRALPLHETSNVTQNRRIIDMLTPAEQARRAAADDALARAKAIAMANAGFVKRIQSELAARQFNALDADLDKLDAAFQRDPAFETLYLNVLYITGSCVKDYELSSVQPYDDWVKAKPSDPWAHVMRASYYFHAACHARGGDVSSKVKQQQWQEMHYYNRLSIDDVTKALRLAPKLMPPYEMAINIMSNQGASSQIPAFYKLAHAAVPTSYLIAESYMAALEPRWGGSWNAMQQFGDQISQEADRNPRFWTFQGSMDADRADTYYENKDYQHAFESYDEALKYGDDTDWLERAANAATGINDYDAALKYDERIHVYDHALEQDSIYLEDQRYCLFSDCPPSKHASFPWQGEHTKLPSVSREDVL